MQETIATTPNLAVVEASVEDVVLDENDTYVRGILTADGITH